MAPRKKNTSGGASVGSARSNLSSASVASTTSADYEATFMARMRENLEQSASEVGGMERVRKKILTVVIYFICCIVFAQFYVLMEYQQDRQSRINYKKMIHTHVKELSDLKVHDDTVSWRYMVKTKIDTIVTANYEMGIGPDYRLEAWTLINAFVFVLSTTTTIGYGYPAPRTLYGRLFTILLVILGIPFAFMALTDLVDLFLVVERFLWTTLVRKSRKPISHLHSVSQRMSNRWSMSKPLLDRPQHPQPPKATSSSTNKKGLVEKEGRKPVLFTIDSPTNPEHGEEEMLINQNRNVKQNKNMPKSEGKLGKAQNEEQGTSNSMYGQENMDAVRFRHAPLTTACGVLCRASFSVGGIICQPFKKCCFENCIAEDAQVRNEDERGEDIGQNEVPRKESMRSASFYDGEATFSRQELSKHMKNSEKKKGKRSSNVVHPDESPSAENNHYTGPSDMEKGMNPRTHGSRASIESSHHSRRSSYGSQHSHHSHHSSSHHSHHGHHRSSIDGSRRASTDSTIYPPPLLAAYYTRRPSIDSHYGLPSSNREASDEVQSNHRESIDLSYMKRKMSKESGHSGHRGSSDSSGHRSSIDNGHRGSLDSGNKQSRKSLNLSPLSSEDSMIGHGELKVIQETSSSSFFKYKEGEKDHLKSRSDKIKKEWSHHKLDHSSSAESLHKKIPHERERSLTDLHDKKIDTNLIASIEKKKQEIMKLKQKQVPKEDDFQMKTNEKVTKTKKEQMREKIEMYREDFIKSVTPQPQAERNESSAEEEKDQFPEWRSKMSEPTNEKERLREDTTDSGTDTETKPRLRRSNKKRMKNTSLCLKVPYDPSGNNNKLQPDFIIHLHKAKSKSMTDLTLDVTSPIIHLYDFEYDIFDNPHEIRKSLSLSCCDKEEGPCHQLMTDIVNGMVNSVLTHSRDIGSKFEESAHAILKKATMDKLMSMHGYTNSASDMFLGQGDPSPTPSYNSRANSPAMLDVSPKLSSSSFTRQKRSILKHSSSAKRVSHKKSCGITSSHHDHSVCQRVIHKMVQAIMGSLTLYCGQQQVDRVEAHRLSHLAMNAANEQIELFNSTYVSSFIDGLLEHSELNDADNEDDEGFNFPMEAFDHLNSSANNRGRWLNQNNNAMKRVDSNMYYSDGEEKGVLANRKYMLGRFLHALTNPDSTDDPDWQKKRRKSDVAGLPHTGTWPNALARKESGGPKKPIPVKQRTSFVMMMNDEVMERRKEVSLAIAFLNLMIFIFAGASMYQQMTENWDYSQSVYFIFTSISTIGYGDVMPKGNTLFFLGSSMYILMGLALLAKIIQGVRGAMLNFMLASINKVEKFGMALVETLTKQHKSSFATSGSIASENTNDSDDDGNMPSTSKSGDPSKRKQKKKGMSRDESVASEILNSQTKGPPSASASKGDQKKRFSASSEKGNIGANQFSSKVARQSILKERDPEEGAGTSGGASYVPNTRRTSSHVRFSPPRNDQDGEKITDDSKTSTKKYPRAEAQARDAEVEDGYASDNESTNEPDSKDTNTTETRAGSKDSKMSDDKRLEPQRNIRRISDDSQDESYHVGSMLRKFSIFGESDHSSIDPMESAPGNAPQPKNQVRRLSITTAEDLPETSSKEEKSMAKFYNR